MKIKIGDWAKTKQGRILHVAEVFDLGTGTGQVKLQDHGFTVWVRTSDIVEVK